MRTVFDPFDAQYDGNSLRTEVVEKTKPMEVIQFPAFKPTQTNVVIGTTQNILANSATVAPYTHLVQTIPQMEELDTKIKAHTKIEQFLNQEVKITIMNYAFPTVGTLIHVNGKLLVVRTVIGVNKHNKEIMDDLIVMINNIVSISRNPRNME